MSPTHARNLAASTAAVLHLDVANGGIAPPGINHLPCQIVLNAAATAVLTFIDSTGTTVTLQLSPGVPVRMAPKEIPVGNLAALTIFWNPEP